MSNDGPIHQILRVEDGKSGKTVETGSRHVVIVSYAANIGVTIVCTQNGVVVLAVSKIGYPYVGHVGFLVLLSPCIGSTKCGGKQQGTHSL